MRILTQSQIIFWRKSKFQNWLNQQMLTPDEKTIFFEEQLSYLRPLTYHKFMKTFFCFGLIYQKTNFFSKNPIFQDPPPPQHKM